MARDYYQWFELTSEYLQVKFVDTLDSAKLINANIEVTDDAATPNVIVDPFKTINILSDYSSISRLLTLYFNSDLATGTYTITFSGLEDFLGNPLPDFGFEFDYVAESATPSQGLLQPSREPVEVEDYSIKNPTWSVVSSGQSGIGGEGNTVTVLDIAPGISQHHYMPPSANEGKIDLYFSSPIATNFITPFYFSLSAKEVKKGLSRWETVPTLILSNLDSTIISVLLPSQEALDSATPSLVYSNELTDEEIEETTFFKPQTKYKLFISTDVGL